MSNSLDRPASSRRAFVGTMLGAGAALAIGGREAAAGRAWCRVDPLVIIGGVLADIFVAGPLTALLKVTGPYEMVVTVPEGVAAQMVLPDLVGFGRGSEFDFEKSSKLRQTDDGIEVKIEVYVPARDDFPVKVEFAPRILGLLRPESADGTANEWITLRSML